MLPERNEGRYSRGLNGEAKLESRLPPIEFAYKLFLIRFSICFLIHP